VQHLIIPTSINLVQDFILPTDVIKPRDLLAKTIWLFFWSHYLHFLACRSNLQLWTS